MKTVFLDRDGTINYERNYVHKIEDFELIPGTLEALRLLTDCNIKIYIITNQAGIARGYYKEKQFLDLTRYMLSCFDKNRCKIEKVLYCPHHPDGTIPEYTRKCQCRKPGTKLIEDVMDKEKLNANEIALVGDRDSDVEAGFKLGLTTYLVLTGYGREYQNDTRADYIKPDMLSAVKHLIQNF
ncbi:D-glycero-alpha-D-manno-heptose-1,7-bisphosphate 7-phosphatase [Candidatus Scalindua japonica]|uniref:D-glycero-alpha-D-manno-heptose-1,7-bisphosphate 7-phosphatase n=1 Tax=Candidatus Scalindua japonica TaxID=1284222 RepID=UPI0013A5563B|nr:HAD family hydrolase [Candidatus Scalindua japonica]